MEKLIKGFAIFFALFVVATGLALILAYPTLWVVNYLFSPQLLTFVFGAAKITFWKAFVLNWFLSIARSSSTSTSKS